MYVRSCVLSIVLQMYGRNLQWHRAVSLRQHGSCITYINVYAFALYCIARNTVACYMYLRTALLRLLPCRNIDRPMRHLPVESAFSLSLYLARIT